MKKTSSIIAALAVSTLSAQAAVIGYWDFDTAGGSGFLADQSGNGNDLTNIGGVAQNTTGFGQPAGLSGSNTDMATFASAGTEHFKYGTTLVDVQNDFTAEAFVNVDSIGSNQIITSAYRSGDRGWRFYVSSTGQLGLEIGRTFNKGTFWSSTQSISAGTNYYVAASVDTSTWNASGDDLTVTFYMQDLNGSNLISESITKNPLALRNATGETFEIGSHSDGTVNHFGGDIDEVRLSNTILDGIAGGSNADLMIVSTIPEPSTYATLFGAFVGVIACYRRQRR